jgi:uncharacterized membrane protein YuzA (DUF378 family)
MAKSVVDWIVLILVFVGGLNWGLVGLLNLDLVATIFGSIPILQKIVYVVVAIAAIVLLYGEVKKK